MIQDTTIQQIKTQHVSKHGLEGPPEQETNTPEVNSRTFDKWAQEITHRPKGEGRWAQQVVGRPPWSADGPVGPTAFRFHVEVSHWLLMAV